MEECDDYDRRYVSLFSLFEKVNRELNPIMLLMAIINVGWRYHITQGHLPRISNQCSLFFYL